MASAMTSGPIPSPGRTAMLYDCILFFLFLSHQSAVNFLPLFCKEGLVGDFNDIKFTAEVDVTSAKSPYPLFAKEGNSID